MFRDYKMARTSHIFFAPTVTHAKPHFTYVHVQIINKRLSHQSLLFLSILSSVDRHTHYCPTKMTYVRVEHCKLKRLTGLERLTILSREQAESSAELACRTRGIATQCNSKGPTFPRFISLGPSTESSHPPNHLFLLNELCCTKNNQLVHELM